MQLIYILVIAVSVLTILSAVTLLMGSAKSEKRRSLWFLAAAIGEVLWGCSIAGFLSLGTSEADQELAPWLLKGIYIGAILMDSTILGYVSWRYRFGKALTTIFLVVGLAMSVLFMFNPALLYSSFTLKPTGNSIAIDMSGWFYIAYILYFCSVVPAFCLSTVWRIRQTNNKNTKRGYMVFTVGLAIAGFMSLVFDLILPISRYDLIWVGPLLIGFTMLAFYYAVLRYRMITLSTGWLKVMSAIVLISSIAIIYLLIFHIVFSALFKINNPSFQVILLNFIMVAIVVLLAPAIAEIWTMIKSLIMTKQIDIAYIVKKLTHASHKKIDLKDISGFLAEHFHVTYVGFLINGRYYVAEEHRIPVAALAALPKLPLPARSIWQPVTTNPEIKTIAKEYGITKIAAITNNNGDTIGQVIIGRPTTKPALTHDDLVAIEMIISLTGTMIEKWRP